MRWSLLLLAVGCSRSGIEDVLGSDAGPIRLPVAEAGTSGGPGTADDDISVDDASNPNDDPSDDDPSDDDPSDDAVVDHDDLAVDDAAGPCAPSQMDRCAGLTPGDGYCSGRTFVLCRLDASGCVTAERQPNAPECVERREGDCGNGLDDDGDGATDCADGDCALACAEDCSNGRDDDGDGLTDCQDRDCIPNAACPEDCVNGLDDDGDGAVDCADAECTGVCATCPTVDGDLASLLGNGIVTGTTAYAGADITASCGRGSASEDFAFSWSAPSSGCFDIDTFGSAFDTTLHVHTPCPEFTEVRCDDDSGDAAQSRITLDLDVGTALVIVVDGFDADSAGRFTLNINQCWEHCADFDDNDLDGLWDCEDPDCFGDPLCVSEICDNGVDDDGDGLSDCEDQDCAASECDSCSSQVDIELGSEMGPGVFIWSTLRAGNDVEASCAERAESEDVVVSWIAPESGCFAFDTFGSSYDTALHLHGACPAFSELACNDDQPSGTWSRVSTVLAAGERTHVVIDGYADTSAGDFVLNVEYCSEVCDDGTDDDLDGLIDCADPDCAGELPCAVEDCTDDEDNDADGAVDCADPDCMLADECLACPLPDVELGTQLGSPVLTGTTLGQFADFEASCARNARSEDVLVSWVAPYDGCFTLSTDFSNYDTALHVRSDCPDFAELACDDDSGQLDRSQIELEALQGVRYFIIVDGYSSSSAGDYQLSIFDCP